MSILREEIEMTLTTQNKKCFINYNNVVAVQVQGNYIHAFFSANESTTIGTYSSEERALEVMSKLREAVCWNKPAFWMPDK